MKDRQLSVLRNAFPSYRIDYEPGPDGRWIWVATADSLETAAAGVRREVQSHSPVDLMASLTYQAWLIARAASRTP
ncbi:hypothetical protein FXF51_34700 [Nonomuraea sp. PA05]|nr:hypothetical protein FXF51_34700 [Nonomuraea sp. PA05]